jgi:hypothetical protein
MTEQPADDAATMHRYAITKVEASVYHYRDWRYGTLKDALAQAQREEGKSAA